MMMNHNWKSREQQQQQQSNNNNNSNSNNNNANNNNIPRRTPPPEDTYDVLLSRELLALSVQERTQALNEIHGVEDFLPEPSCEERNPSLVNCALELLQIAITQQLILTTGGNDDGSFNNTNFNNNNNINGHNNPQEDDEDFNNSNFIYNDDPTSYAYRLALRQNQSYVESRFLRLAFLRAENFFGNVGWEKELLSFSSSYTSTSSSKTTKTSSSQQQPKLQIPSSIQKIVDRIMNFFKLKLKLWGMKLLTKDICLDDLDEGDKHCLYKGYMTLLPERDRAGRAVIVCLASLIVGCTAQNVNRSFYYVLQCALEDIETQRKGVVCIGYNIDRQSSTFTSDIETIESQALETNSNLMQYFYFRMTAMQIVYNDPRIKPLMGFVVYWIGRHIRARFRAHFGAGHIEGQYTLMTFGIPTYCLPIDSNGVINLYYHLEWLQKRQIQEQQQQQLQQQQQQQQILLSSMQPLEQVLSSPFEFPISSSSSSTASQKIPSDETTISMVSRNGGPTTNGNVLSNRGTINGRHKASLTATLQNGTSSSHKNKKGDDEDDDNTNISSSRPEEKKRQKQRKTIYQVPGPDDVLVGRGKLANRHIGNKKYNQLVEQYFDQYNASTRFEKTIVAEIIVKTIQETNNGGKFLKLGDEGWMEIDDSDSRSKVAHTFRNFRRKPTSKKGKNNGGGGEKRDNHNNGNGSANNVNKIISEKNISNNNKNGGRSLGKVTPKQQPQQQNLSRLLTLPPVPSSGEVIGGGNTTTAVAPSFLPPIDPLSSSFLSCLGGNNGNSSNNSNNGCTPTGCLPTVCLAGYDIGSVGGTWMDGTRQPRMM